ncbi:differentially expressed in FDCP 8 homolog A isoform X2 [Periplaneta americana]|uniref:differentially expressed in FDCP 8 homolog A isoform X2 n=1 Tax=Periplaneta americana TaxID=6978 RepID=UPI0037E8224C
MCRSCVINMEGNNNNNKVIFESSLDDNATANQTFASTPSSSTSGCVSGDDTSEGKAVIPASLVTAENYLTISEEAQTLTSIEDLARAVEQCKEMVLESSECSEERKWLVRRLIELRLRLQEAREAAEDAQDCHQEVRVVRGHHFTLQSQPAPTTKHHCDRCCGVIWSVVHSWYQCVDCKYSCHVKCLAQVCRVCAHVKASENPTYIPDICPELGLSAQAYRCAECKAHITFKNSWVEPRLCDYDGRYYCPSCHWNSTAVIPARVVHNWDFEERRVCRASKQLLRIMEKRPVLKLQQLNPRLFGFVEELSLVKKIREDILVMKKYFVSCRDAIESRLLWQLQERQHFVENVDSFSLQDLIDINSGELLEYLEKVQAVFVKHIKEDCKLCYGRGFVCEMCDDDEVIFPFDVAAAVCQKCCTVFHRNCWTKKNQQCPKCVRIEKRASLRRDSTSSEEDNLSS